MTSNNLKQIVDEKNGVMIRVDKTLKEMMDERSTGNISAGYWHPKYEEIINVLKKIKNLKPLSNYIPNKSTYITYGQVGKREYTKNLENAVHYITTKNLVDTGINWYLVEKYVVKNGWNDPVRSRPSKNDILFIGNGVGCAGRCIWLPDDIEGSNIEQNIVILRTQNIIPAFVVTFLKTKYGINQIFRLKDRVGPAYINFTEIRSILIPALSNQVQQNIEKEYLKMHKFHEKAMEAKKENNESEYQKNIKIAEAMLNDLIRKTEQMIRGERKDVI